ELHIGVSTQIDADSVIHVGTSLTKLPRLESLELAAKKIVVNTLNLPSIRRLAFHAQQAITFECGDDQVANPIKLDALTELIIDTQTLGAGDAPLRALLATPPPHLSTLRLERVSTAPVFLRELSGGTSSSALLKQLKVLDLRRTQIS